MGTPNLNRVDLLDEVVRATRRALPAIAVALLLLAASATGTFHHASAASIVLWLIICIAGGMSVLYPVSSSIAIGAVLTLAVTIPWIYIGLGVFGALVAFAATTARGRPLSITLIGLWFAVALITPTVTDARSSIDIIAGGGVWLFFLASAAAVGMLFRRLGSLLRESRARRIADLSTQRHALARELHDTAVRATTEVVMIAERSRLRSDIDPESARDLERISESARVATDELRAAMDALRRTEAPGSVPPPEDRTSTTLMDTAQQRLHRAGFRVNVDVEGEVTIPGRIADPLSRSLAELAANVIRHGDDEHPVALMMETTSDLIDVVVMNRRRAEGPSNIVGGSGLIGARDRLAAIGGTMDTRTDGSSFLARMSVPLRTEER